MDSKEEFGINKELRSENLLLIAKEREDEQDQVGELDIICDDGQFTEEIDSVIREGKSIHAEVSNLLIAIDGVRQGEDHSMDSKSDDPDKYKLTTMKTVRQFKGVL